MDKVDANNLQVRVELQADCLARVWANRVQEKWQFIEPGDVESALQTASAIGDDRLQRRSQRYVVPVHPRLFGSTDALVHDRFEIRKC
jgi:uncharacterized protein